MIGANSICQGPSSSRGRGRPHAVIAAGLGWRTATPGTSRRGDTASPLPVECSSREQQQKQEHLLSRGPRGSRGVSRSTRMLPNAGFTPLSRDTYYADHCVTRQPVSKTARSPCQDDATIVLEQSPSDGRHRRNCYTADTDRVVGYGDGQKADAGIFLREPFFGASSRTSRPRPATWWKTWRQPTRDVPQHHQSGRCAGADFPGVRGSIVGAMIFVEPLLQPRKQHVGIIVRTAGPHFRATCCTVSAPRSVHVRGRVTTLTTLTPSASDHFDSTRELRLYESLRYNSVLLVSDMTRDKLPST